jgi:hypothetical protein
VAEDEAVEDGAGAENVVSPPPRRHQDSWRSWESRRKPRLPAGHD